jgi:UDP-galactopyranose mutase
MNTDILVAGAGFAGSVISRELADAGLSVLVVDRREHIGGNAFDTTDEHGVLVHPYGPHIFHTNAARIVEYLSRFTSWRQYEHRVKAVVDGKLYPFPINRDTINLLYGLSLTTEQEAAAYFKNVAEKRNPLKSSEDVVLNALGRDLYEKFFRGYTRKQWGRDASELAASVAARIPFRENTDDRYFTDEYQMMPAGGYTAMFERMLDHPNICVRTGTDYSDVRSVTPRLHTVFTGPIDEYYGFNLGRLPYRSLRFEHQHLSDVECYQPCGTVNYPNDHEYTRITEFKHITGQHHAGTSIVREYPSATGDPYYPVPMDESAELYARYKALADREDRVTFVGRLAQYRYYNMDQVVGSALSAAERLLKNFGLRASA